MADGLARVRNAKMTLNCFVCGKEIPSWPAGYRSLAAKLAVKTPFGPAHEICWRFAKKRQTALTEGRDIPWQAEDPEKLSSSELGRVRRAEEALKSKVDRQYNNTITGNRKKYFPHPLQGSFSGMKLD